MFPRLELICVGTELLSGKTSTHGAAVARALEGLGLELSLETTVGDDPREMREAFSRAWRRSGVVLCAGGLGPTFDDITRDVWARVLKTPLRFDPSLFKAIGDRFRSRGLRMPPDNRRQAYLLSGARAMENPHGTAPGQIFVRGGKVLALFPGPGPEIFPMLEDKFIPFLRGRIPALFRRARTYRIFGGFESRIDEVLRPLVRREKSARRVRVVWGILAQSGVVDIKAAVSGPVEREVEERFRRIDRGVMRTFGRQVYGFGGEALEEVVGKLLRERGETLALAESCTGGLLAAKLTRIPGSSEYFREARVTYANESKVRLLGVSRRTLKKFGAVSEPCAREMARGCRRLSGAHWAVAVTGIAGPGGGTPEKPAGLVFIAWAGPRGVKCRRFQWKGDRDRVRELSALWALNGLREELLRKN